MTLFEYVAKHHNSNKQQNTNIRLGQRFCNEFMTTPNNKLFYEKDDENSVGLIYTWMQDNHYHSISDIPKAKRL